MFLACYLTPLETGELAGVVCCPAPGQIASNILQGGGSWSVLSSLVDNISIRRPSRSKIGPPLMRPVVGQSTAKHGIGAKAGHALVPTS